MNFLRKVGTLAFVLFSTRSVHGASHFTSRDHKLLYQDTKEFLLKGVNYAGFETYCYAPSGLWAHDLDFYMDFIAKNDFNAIRLPLSYDLSLNLDTAPPSSCVFAQTDECSRTSGNLLDCVFQKALARNLFIVVDLHTIGSVITEHPYGNLTRDEFVGAWDRLLDRVIHYPNLMGIDIKNEPHGDTTWEEWGGIVNDFRTHIYERYPDYQGVFFVEGIQGDDSCWGGSFAGLTNQVDLSRHDIVFSPHTYGVSVLGDVAIQYDHEDFHKWFGSLKDRFDNVIILGEAGGFFTGEDMLWHFRYANYLKTIHQTSTFYWSLNPNSGDTRGILNDDWTTYNVAKLHFLKDLQPAPTKIRIDSRLLRRHAEKN